MPSTSNEFLSWATGSSSSESTYTLSSDLGDSENIPPLNKKKKKPRTITPHHSAEDGHSLAQEEYKDKKPNMLCK